MPDEVQIPLIILKAKKLLLESMKLLHLRGHLRLDKSATPKGEAWVFTISIPVKNLVVTDEGDASGSFRSLKKEAQKSRG